MPPRCAQENLPRHADEYRQREANKRHTQPYFTAMAALQQAVSARDYEQARVHALEALKHVPGFVDEMLLDFETFDVGSIPPLEIGGLVFALLDDRAGIELVRSIAASRDQLAKWKDINTQHEDSRALFRAIECVVADKPGVLQNGLKHEVGATDGRRVSTLIDWLEKAGRIRRDPSGKTYALSPPRNRRTCRRQLGPTLGSSDPIGAETRRANEWLTGLQSLTYRSLVRPHVGG